MNDNYLLYSAAAAVAASGCNFSLIPPKPKIPVLTVKREMYPFRFQDTATSKSLSNMSVNCKPQNDRINLEVEIQFVRENDKSTINTIRKRALVDQRTTLADLPTQLLSEIGCVIDPSLAQVEVFGLRMLDWSCLIPLDVVSEDISSSTVAEKLSVLTNYLLFFYRVSVKGSRDSSSAVDVWSVVFDLAKRHGTEGAYHRLKQMNCPLLKTNSSAFLDFLFQLGSVSLDSLDPSFQLSFLDMFSFDNWYRSFPIHQFLGNGSRHGPASVSTTTTTTSTMTSPPHIAAAFDRLSTSLQEVLRQRSSTTGSATAAVVSGASSSSAGAISCDSIIQEALRHLSTELPLYPASNIPLTAGKFPLGASLGLSPVPEVGGATVTMDTGGQHHHHNGVGVVHDGISNCTSSALTSGTSKRKVRNRVTFVSEDLRQLEAWFKDNPRPSRDRFQEYAGELNRRHGCGPGNKTTASLASGNSGGAGKRTLHARNIVYWFKNARAAHKRLSSLGGVGGGCEGEKLGASEDDGSVVMKVEESESAELEEDEDGEEGDEEEGEDDEEGEEEADMEENEDEAGNVFLGEKGSSRGAVKEEPGSADETGTGLVGNATVGTASGSGGGNLVSGKRRARIFLDPGTEVARLEQWFRQERYPDVVQIEGFTAALNCSPYRQNHFRKLAPENVTLWFKNRRARLKRCLPPSSSTVASSSGSNLAAAPSQTSPANS